MVWTYSVWYGHIVHGMDIQCMVWTYIVHGMDIQCMVWTYIVHGMDIYSSWYGHTVHGMDIQCMVWTYSAWYGHTVHGMDIQYMVWTYIHVITVHTPVQCSFLGYYWPSPCCDLKALCPPQASSFSASKPLCSLSYYR